MIRWEVKKFRDLSIDDLYEILRLRQEVFIIEQNCNYLDADGLDLYSTHLMAYFQDELIGYLRIVQSGKIYDTISWGRILVKNNFRKKGYGKAIIQKAIELLPPNSAVTISAQLYLQKFYEYFNFKALGDTFLEDDIPHIKMIKNV